MKTAQQRWVIDQKNKQRWLNLCPTLTNSSGIYILTRYENGFKYCYVGQSKHILQRLVEHLRGYQHIDISIQKRKLYDEKKNPNGWNLHLFVECEEKDLDKQEQDFIKEFADMGYQLRYNKTGGGQYDKVGFEKEQSRGYYKGVAHGKKKQMDEIKEYFYKYLDVCIKGKPNKIKTRKLQQFKELILIDKN